MIMPGAIRIEFEDEQFSRLFAVLQRIAEELETLNSNLEAVQSVLTDIFSSLERIEFKTGG